MPVATLEREVQTNKQALPLNRAAFNAQFAEYRVGQSLPSDFGQDSLLKPPTTLRNIIQTYAVETAWQPRTIPNPEANGSKIEIPEEDKNLRWAMFIQPHIIQPWISDEGEAIQNVVAVSMPLPPGTQHLMAEIMTEARSKIRPREQLNGIYSFNNQDSLLMTEEIIPQTQADEDVLDIFEHLMDAADTVINTRVLGLSSDAVTEFFHYQQERRNSLDKLKADARALLFSGDKRNLNAWGSEYGGFFLMKHTITGDGITWGVDPNDKDDVVDGHITRGELGHTELMNLASAKNSQLMKEKRQNVTLRWIADSTVDVEDCINGCSTFFKKKMKAVSGSAMDDIVRNKASVLTEAKKVMGDTIQPDDILDGLDAIELTEEEKEKLKKGCKNCGKGQEECNCKDKDKKN